MNGKKLSAQVATPFTPLPNHFIDEVMPTLKDTEWRLLCVIVRQTLGWSDSHGKRKQRDWLTQRQLMNRTGRSSEAISAALDALIRRRLIDACDAGGALLLTPAQRRRHRGAIFYGLCSHESNAPSNTAKSELQKANTTKEMKDKRNIYIKRSDDREDSITINRGWARADQLAASRYLGCLNHPEEGTHLGHPIYKS